MILQCTQCAGSVTAESDAIRRGMVTCNYCQTQLRITQTGISTYTKQLLATKPPDKIRIKRRHNHIQILIPALLTPGRTLGHHVGIWRWVPYVGAVLLFLILTFRRFFMSLINGTPDQSLINFGLGLPALFLGWIILMFMTAEPHPHIILKDGKLLVPPLLKEQKHAFDFQEIKQLYVTTNQIKNAKKQATKPVFNLYILARDGKRHLAHNGFSSLEGALYVEELIEIELDILNLPVLGETGLDVKNTAVFHQESPQKMDCFACAAPLNLTPTNQTQGFVQCAYCQTITILYNLQGRQHILGLHNPSQQNYITTYKGRLAGVKKKSNEASVLLLKDGIIQTTQNNRVQNHKVIQFGLKKKSKPADNDFFSSEFSDKYQLAMAYTQDMAGEANAVDPMELILNDVSFVLVGKVRGDVFPLLDNIDSFMEAAHMVAVLNEYLNKL